jgi:hypothetical protein
LKKVHIKKIKFEKCSNVNKGLGFKKFKITRKEPKKTIIKTRNTIRNQKKSNKIRNPKILVPLMDLA